ncbi:MAG TPA: hypothetical protein PK323_13015 [Bacteroidia bacterium]|nr:hypothetical protein [Bacteroidia bacterium]
MFDNYNYEDSFLHVYILNNLVEYSLCFLVGKLIYLRIQHYYLTTKNSELKLNAVRNQIAYEMHQDIGNDLNALLFKLKSWHIKNGGRNNREFEQVEKSTIGILTKVNDIVWSLNNEKNNLSYLQEHFIGYADETLTNAQINTEIFSAEKLPLKKISLDIKKNLFLLYKEAINNIIKHANTENVIITFAYKRSKFKIKIVDFGRGFDENSIIKGNGIDSMQSRIKLLKGNLSFQKNIPNGTVVIIEIKI